MMTKDLNFSVFSDTSGWVSETYQWDWSVQIYSIFNNNDISDLQYDQPIYERIRDSSIHMIAARLVVLPYNDVFKWIIDHANIKDRYFNNSTGFLLSNFRSETFVKFMLSNHLDNSLMLISSKLLSPGIILMKCWSLWWINHEMFSRGKMNFTLLNGLRNPIPCYQQCCAGSTVYLIVPILRKNGL